MRLLTHTHTHTHTHAYIHSIRSAEGGGFRVPEAGRPDQEPRHFQRPRILLAVLPRELLQPEKYMFIRHTLTHILSIIHTHTYNQIFLHTHTHTHTT
jgi:hypothetical protein